MNFDPNATGPKPPSRAVAIGLAVAAALGLLVASFSQRWLASPIKGLDMGFGLRSFSACGDVFGGRLGDGDGPADASTTKCDTKSNSEVMALARQYDPDHASGAFVPCGWVTFVSNLLAAAALLAGAGLVAAKKRPTLPIAIASFALLALMVSLIVGCVFLATKPGGVTGVGVAWAFWVFSVAVILGIAAAQLLGKLLRPADPDLLADALTPDQF